MKKIFITLISLSAYGSLQAQDTLTVHKKLGKKIKFQLNRIDSVSFNTTPQSHATTLKVHNNGFPTITSITKPKDSLYTLVDIDSLSFQKADTIDYKSPNGFSVLTDAAYTFSASWYGKIEGFGLGEVGTDIWHLGEQLQVQNARTVNEVRDIFNYKDLPTNDVLARQWKQLYSAVNICNLGLKIAAEQQLPSTDIRVQRSAELRFLRAFYYWNIVETWGGVHLTTEPFYVPNIKINQSPLPLLLPTANNSSVDQFYELIFSDLQYAISNLPVTSTFSNRITKPIAEAFLARMYLTRNKNTEARDLAKSVIDNYNYSLVTNYSELWDMTKQNNSEAIWKINWEMNDVYHENNNLYGYGYEDQSTGRGRQNAHTLFVNRYDNPTVANSHGFIISKDSSSHWPLAKDMRNGNGFNRFVPTPHLLNLFDEAKDARYNGSFQTVWLANKAVTKPAAPKKFARGDTAIVVSKNTSPSSKYFTLDYLSLFNADGSAKNKLKLTFAPTLVKHLDSTRYLDPSKGPNETGPGKIQSFKEVVVMRLAEMYLIAAEAELKLGNLPAAKEYINAIRRRAALKPELQKAMEVSEDLTIDFILDERARELAGEYLRWYDLKRTGKLLERVRLKNPDIGNQMSEYHIVRPVPKIQLDNLKGGTLTQNPGY